jgi:iron complex outermembrane receptor protein
VRRIPTADGSIFVRPAMLRNLSPYHTLVLIGGKRFHRSAFVDVIGDY